MALHLHDCMGKPKLIGENHTRPITTSRILVARFSLNLIASHTLGLAIVWSYIRHAFLLLIQDDRVWTASNLPNVAISLTRETLFVEITLTQKDRMQYHPHGCE